jgi:apolipoprotein D and lipocalin family protein
VSRATTWKNKRSSVKILKISMRRLVSACCAFAFSTLLATSLVAQQTPSVKAISQIDISQYMGSWYEIAKLPNWFQRNCTQNTKATYQLINPAQIQVLNQCQTANGEIIQALGMARPRPNGLPAQLEVRFAPSWLGLLPFVWGDYWVLDLDPQYQLAAVGDPSKKYLWILSRTPQISETSYKALTQRLSLMGFDVSRLEKTTQN